MNRVEKIVICLACGLALNAGLRADDAVPSANPYEPIVARNIFSLNPPTPVEVTPPDGPPPKITPNGITTVLGQLQVLFKVAVPAKPGQPAKDNYYILSEGQRQDDIEVVKIDEKNSVVTFKNHGEMQELPLAAAPATATTAPSAPGGNPPVPRFTPPGANVNNGGGFNRFGRGRNRGGVNSGNYNDGADDGSNLRSIPTRGGYSGQQSQMSAEEQAATILVNTEKYKEQGNPAYKLMPPIPGFNNQSGNQ